MTIDFELLDVLACPKDNASLDYSHRDAALICTLCCTEYRVEDGIPILLLERSGPG